MKHTIIVTGIALALMVQTSRAALLAQDTFSYATNATIVGQGSDSNWPTAGKKWTGATTAIMETGDMSYSNLAVSGDSVEVQGNNQGVFRALGVTNSTAGQILWLSALMQVDQSVGNSYAGVSLYSGATEKFFFGQRNVDSKWGIEISNNGPRTDSTVSTASNVTAFLVVELDGIAGAIRLYVNPTTLGGNAPATASATISFANFSFDTFRIQSGGAEKLDVDELRLGTTYASVTPMAVPEPTTALLLALGGGLTCLLRLKQRL